MNLFIDIETKSEIDLINSSQTRYARGADADILLLYYMPEGGTDPVLWEPGKPVPLEFSSAEKYIARNFLFDMNIIKWVGIPKYGFPERMADPSNWICTRALSLQAGLPGSLDGSAKALQVPQQKQEAGKGLIAKYSIPVWLKDTEKELFSAPDKPYYFRELKGTDLDLYRAYCQADVIADSQVYEKIKGIKNREIEQGIFILDAWQNIRGLRVDVPAMEKYIDCYNAVEKRALDEAKKYGVNPRSPKDLMEWLTRSGYKITDTQADTVQAMIYKAMHNGAEKVVKVLQLRQFLAKTSVKKFQALADRVIDGRLHDFLRYYGAHTGRWSGSGFQPHNLPKTGTGPDAIDEAIESLSPDMHYNAIIDAGQKILPGLIIPDDGNTFLIGDFSAVEARGVAYLAGQADLLNDFSAGVDVYVKNGSRITGTPIEKIDKKSRPRTVGKVAVLSCGYGAGVKGITGMLKNYGLETSETLAASIVTGYREQYRAVVSFWYECENKFYEAIKRPGKDHQIGDYIQVRKTGRSLKVLLPSGRSLYYHNIQADKDGLIYTNYEKKIETRLWGGLILENITQAVCRDIMADRMLKCVANGLRPVLHVHDEIVIETKDATAEKDLILFEKIMNTAPAWLKGFPLATEAEISRRYHK